jgi:hypothetical protein
VCRSIDETNTRPSAIVGAVSWPPTSRCQATRNFDADGNNRLNNIDGPEVTTVGIVTAILNPSEQRTFIGIGFAVPIENAAGAAGMPPF